MRQIVQNMKDGQTDIVDVPVPQAKPGHILIRTGASLVSAGTERMLVDFAEKGVIGKAKSRPDLLQQIFEKARRDGVLATFQSAMNRLDQPIVLGYSSSGTVIEIGEGVDRFAVGDRVACAGGGYAVHAEYALIPVNLAAKLPDSVSFEEGAFATIGAIALNGIRLSQPQIGENTAVIGLGLLGLIAVQILRSSGCNVVGMDLDQDRVELARNLGIQAFDNQHVVDNFLHITGGYGFDHIFICADTSSNQPVEVAAEIASDRGTIVAVGAVGMDIPRKPYYEKELTFKVSRSYGPGRYDPTYEEQGFDYPPGYVRWTEGRNLASIVEMIDKKRLDIKPLISHRFVITEALDAYALLTGKNDEKYLGLIINYLDEKSPPEYRNYIQVHSSHKKTDRPTLSVGVIGAGNYANAMFLPVIQKHPVTACHAIASARGLHAQQSARKFGFSYATSDEQAILQDKDVDITVILTQHDSHSRLTTTALKKGKHVFCEKPLSIDRQGIKEVSQQLNKEGHPYLTVGFNRRFAPFIREIHTILDNSSEPVYAHYRVNAGYLPPNHWLHDQQIGGGRLIGEACHFIDLMLYLVGSDPTRVFTRVLPDSGKYRQDNFLTTIDFENGSIASIAYMANGSRSAGKEYIELFSAGRSIFMHDFKRMDLYGSSKKTRRAIFKQDKGHAALWDAFVKAVKDQSPPPIPYESLLLSSYTTLAAARSMQEAKPVTIKDFINS